MSPNRTVSSINNCLYSICKLLQVHQQQKEDEVKVGLLLKEQARGPVMKDTYGPKVLQRLCLGLYW